MRIFKAFRAGLSEVRGFVPRLLSIGRQLINELVGFAFIALAVFVTFSANGLIHSFRRMDETAEDSARFFIALGFLVMFGWFGWSSFRRARRISRER